MLSQKNIKSVHCSPKGSLLRVCSSERRVVRDPALFRSITKYANFRIQAGTDDQSTFQTVETSEIKALPAADERYNDIQTVCVTGATGECLKPRKIAGYVLSFART